MKRTDFFKMLDRLGSDARLLQLEDFGSERDRVLGKSYSRICIYVKGKIGASTIKELTGKATNPKNIAEFEKYNRWFWERKNMYSVSAVSKKSDK